MFKLPSDPVTSPYHEDFECILDNRVHEIVEITVNQAGFVKNYWRNTHCTVTHISVGVHQGSTLSPLLFVLVMNTATRDIERPTPYTLLYADSEQLVQKWNDHLMQHGLRLNLNKTEILTTDPHEAGIITDLPRTERLKYSGSMLLANVKLRYKIAPRIKATWMKQHSTNVFPSTYQRTSQI